MWRLTVEYFYSQQIICVLFPSPVEVFLSPQIPPPQISAQYRKKRLTLVEERTRLCNELLTGIRVVKVFAWEAAYLQKIENLRAKELRLAQKELDLKFYSVCNTVLNPLFAQVLTLFVFVLANPGTPLAPSTVFSFLNLSQQLRIPILRLGLLMNSLFQMRDGVTRMERFVKTGSVDEEDGTSAAKRRPSRGRKEHREEEGKDVEEGVSEERLPLTGGKRTNSFEGVPAEEEDDVEQFQMSKAELCGISPLKSGSNDSVMIRLRDAVLGWPETARTVSARDEGQSSVQVKTTGGAVVGPVNLDIRRGEILVLLGEVGSGKTTFLSALTSDALVASAASPGTSASLPLQIQPNLKLALVTQSAWVRNASIKDNVLFFRVFDQQKYDRAVRMAQLHQDFAQFEAGDATEIGERGITLSGGQKMRVALARALYDFDNTDLFLFDDVFSALDADTSAKVAHAILDAHRPSQTMLFAAHKKFWEPRMEETGKVKLLWLGGPGAGSASVSSALVGGGGALGSLNQIVEGVPGDVVRGDVVLGGVGGIMGPSGENDRGGSLTDDLAASTSSGVSAEDAAAHGSGHDTQQVGDEEERRDGGEIIDEADALLLAAAASSADHHHEKTDHHKKKDSENPKTAAIMTVEHRGTSDSAFGIEILKGLYRAIGQPGRVWFFLITFLVCEPIVYFLFDGWLNTWMAANSATTSAGKSRSSLFPFLSDFANTLQLKIFHTSSLTAIPQHNRQLFYVLTYAIIFFFRFVVTVTNKTAMPKLGILGAESLFSSMLKSVVRAPVAFFDTTPLGRILTRFGFDTENNDTAVVWKAQPAVDLLRMLCEFLILNCILFFPWFFFTLPVLALGFWYFRRISKNAVREYQKLDNLTRSPIAALVTESLSGLPTIRAFQVSEVYQEKFQELTDRNQRAIFAFNSAQRWLNMRVDLLTNVILTVSIIAGVGFNLDAALMGTGVTLLLMFTGYFGPTIMLFGQLEAAMTSVERAIEYGEGGLKRDGGWHGTLDAVTFVDRTEKNKWMTELQVGCKTIVHVVMHTHTYCQIIYQSRTDVIHVVYCTSSVGLCSILPE